MPDTTAPAELRRKPAKIGIPDVVSARTDDLVVIGSPTWWLSTNVPVRSFLESATADHVLDGTPFAAAVVCRRPPCSPSGARRFAASPTRHSAVRSRIGV
jgi:hypothetical protein